MPLLDGPTLRFGPAMSGQSLSLLVGSHDEGAAEMVVERLSSSTITGAGRTSVQEPGRRGRSGAVALAAACLGGAAPSTSVAAPADASRAGAR